MHICMDKHVCMHALTACRCQALSDQVLSKRGNRTIREACLESVWNSVKMWLCFSFLLSRDHSLGSHKIFQKNKSVIQLHLQKNRDTPGKLSRKVRLSECGFHLGMLTPLRMLVLSGWLAAKVELLRLMSRCLFQYSY